MSLYYCDSLWSRVAGSIKSLTPTPYDANDEYCLNSEQRQRWGRAPAAVSSAAAALSHLRSRVSPPLATAPSTLPPQQHQQPQPQSESSQSEHVPRFTDLREMFISMVVHGFGTFVLDALVNQGRLRENYCNTRSNNSNSVVDDRFIETEFRIFTNGLFTHERRHGVTLLQLATDHTLLLQAEEDIRNRIIHGKHASHIESESKRQLEQLVQRRREMISFLLDDVGVHPLSGRGFGTPEEIDAGARTPFGEAIQASDVWLINKLFSKGTVGDNNCRRKLTLHSFVAPEEKNAYKIMYPSSVSSAAAVVGFRGEFRRPIAVAVGLGFSCELVRRLLELGADIDHVVLTKTEREVIAFGVARGFDWRQERDTTNNDDDDENGVVDHDDGWSRNRTGGNDDGSNAIPVVPVTVQSSSSQRMRTMLSDVSALTTR